MTGPTPDTHALAVADRLEAQLGQCRTPRHVDAAIHAREVLAMIEAIRREGGAFGHTSEPAWVRICGRRASANDGLAGAVRNWITATRKAGVV